MPAKSRLAQLVAKQEGFYKPGSIPSRRHNPGDLRHGPHIQHTGLDPNAVGFTLSDDEGWEDLERQLQKNADRGMSLRELIFGQGPQHLWAFAPPSENDSNRYLQVLCDGLGLPPDTSLHTALTIPAEKENISETKIVPAPSASITSSSSKHTS